MSANENGYQIIPLADLPEEVRQGYRRKGSSVWQPIIDRALLRPGHAVIAQLSAHPELSRVPKQHRSSSVIAMGRRLGLAGRIHCRATADAIYVWIDPPQVEADA